MPSAQHEALIQMFRERPALAAEVLADQLGVMVPPFEQAAVTSADLTEVRPTEYRADAVVTLSNRGSVVHAIIVEVQLGVDLRKRRTWPVYVATLHARLGCAVQLLVVSPSQRVATWAAEPIVIGRPGLVLTPLVVGPQTVPLITDADVARRHPELTVLSVLAHGRRPPTASPNVFDAVQAAFDVFDLADAELYYQVVRTTLPRAAADYLEGLMGTATDRFRTDFAKRFVAEGIAEGIAEGRVEGIAEGEARALLAVLTSRGIEVTDEVREQIAACKDSDQLELWVRRAIVVTKADELFA